MGPYSKELRERVAAAVEHGEGSQREIARRFRVSLTFVFRLLRRRRDAGTLDPKPHGGGPTPALAPRISNASTGSSANSPTPPSSNCDGAAGLLAARPPCGGRCAAAI